MDIEGAEHRVLPHLLHTRAMCLINRVYMEWHGSWSHDEPNGKGSMRYANGDVYEGEWVSGRRHGEGS